jgi:hypothetical protein
LSSARVAIEYAPFGTRAIGAMPASSAAVEICAQAVLHVEEQPVEAGNRHRLGDLDAARHADADAERQLALLKLFARDVADCGGHAVISLSSVVRRP